MAGMIGEVLTWAQIEELFQGEWVLLDEPETEPNLLIKSGRLLWHSNSRAETHRKMMEVPPPVNLAVLYVGSTPKDVAFLL